jgi:hypothetical protein
LQLHGLLHAMAYVILISHISVNHAALTTLTNVTRCACSAHRQLHVVQLHIEARRARAQHTEWCIFARARSRLAKAAGGADAAFAAHSRLEVVDRNDLWCVDALKDELRDAVACIDLHNVVVL